MIFFIEIIDAALLEQQSLPTACLPVINTLLLNTR